MSIDTVETTVDTAVKGFRVNGWAAVAALVAANLIGVLLHF